MTVYTLESLENYDPTWVTGLDTNAIPFVHGLQDKTNVGVRFDFVRRKIMYAMFMYDTDTQVNATGHKIWDGFTTPIANGGNYDATEQKIQWTAEKDIDTGVVTFYDNFSLAKTIPNGIGPQGIGEYDFTTNPANNDTIILNGITWTFKTAGAVGNQTNIKADTLSTINQLSWDLNNSVNASLTPAYYTAGDRSPAGTFCLGITYKTGGVAGNAYTLAAGTYGGVVSGATLTGGATPSDGTWRRFVDSTSSSNDASPLMVDPRTGNVWQHTDSGSLSCAIYLFRRAANFAQEISPYSPPPGQSSHMEMIGISDTWTYIRFEQDHRTHTFTLTLTPRDLTAVEIALDYIVPYAEFVYDPLWNSYYFRSVLNHASSMFTYGGEKSGTRNFKLYRFDEPSAAPFGGPVVGGGFTDITPWGAMTGPNSDVAAYTVDGVFATPSTSYQNKYSLYYLPATNGLVMINKLLAGDTVTGWSDPTLTRFDCTYYDITGVAYDYHKGFVTGYMKADWTTTTNPMLAAWVVLRVREMDLYLGQNTYAFAGVDYTKRWFFFDVQPVVAGAWTYDSSKFFSIMVQYQFIYGAAPAVLQKLPETGWDAAYGAYAADIGNTNVIYNSIGQFDLNDIISNSGISDGNAFIWDGYGVNQNTCYLDPAYIPNRLNYTGGNKAVGPFVRLSFAASPAPGGKWFALLGPARARG